MLFSLKITGVVLTKAVSWVCVSGCCGVASVRRGWGCPVPAPAGSSRLQQPHRRAQQPKWWCLWGMYLRKGKREPKGTREGMPRSEDELCDTAADVHGTYGGPRSGAGGYSLKELQLVEPML